MKLFRDESYQISFLCEGSGDAKKLYLEGIWAQADLKNKNRRVYPKKVLEEAVEKYVNEQVKTNRAVGELGHPATPTVAYDRVCHKILNLEWSGNDVVGKAIVANTPMGDVVRGLHETGINLGVSTRGLGVLNEQNGSSYVQSPFVLSAIDAVHDASAPKAYVQGIMEGVEYFLNAAGEIVTEQIQKEIHAAPKSRHPEIAIKAWAALMESFTR